MEDRWHSNPQLDVANGSPEVEVTPERWQQIKNLFGEALERSRGERGPFLQQACGSDESLRAEVESLLAEQPAAATSGASSVAQPAPAIKDSMVDRRLGPYEIVRRIATGGMATVYLAVRADAQYRKQVAIKILTSGFDSPEIMRRFRNERQTLAALDHPNIVKLLDGGTTPEGVPYLVMDYVEGVAIDQYCDSHKLCISERLRLFRTVCAAVEYAHQKGAIHRDLKPSNILVTADGACKLLDFGIAKVLNPALSMGTLQLTQSGERQLTPAYASPEQVRGEPVTCASDVYSLGVVLYELLTGHRPYKLKRHTPMELERVICDTDPERPSTAVSQTETQTAPDGSTSSIITPESVSRTREGEPQKLQRRLRGDVDNILLMALQKEPQRRYHSMQEFSEDVARHLEDRPVKARPNTLQYRMRKLIRRRKTEMVALALLLVLAGGWGYSLWRQGWRRAPVIPQARASAKAGVPTIHSLAVLPLRNLSGDPNQEYFADGMTEQLIMELSSISSLKVISRTSVMRYKGSTKSLPEIARELAVEGLIEGSVTRDGHRVAVTANLIDASSEKHIWSERYDRDLMDILAVQSDLAQSIAREVQAKVTPSEQARLGSRRMVNVDAYDLYLRGHSLIDGTDEDRRKAVEFFNQAINIDPNDALIYAGIGVVYGPLGYRGYVPPAESDSKMVWAATKALELDENLADAHVALGLARSVHEWDWAAGEREFRRAIDLNPGYASAHSFYAQILMMQGRIEESLIEGDKAARLDPFESYVLWAEQLVWARRYDQAIEICQRALGWSPGSPSLHLRVGIAYEQKGEYSKAVAELEQARDLSPSSTYFLRSLGHAYAVSGKRDQAQEILRQLKEDSTKRYISPFSFVLIYTGLGEKEHAFEWLEKAYQQRDPGLATLRADPRFDLLRGDSRFTDLLKRIHLNP